MTADAMIQVGDQVHGHVGGAFGRDWFQCGRVEYRGPDWCVVRGENGEVGLVVESEFHLLADSRDAGPQDTCSNGLSDGCLPTQW